MTSLLDLPSAAAQQADVLVLPIPYEGTVTYGQGTARAPGTILRASAQIELWDEEVDFQLDSLRVHVAPPVEPTPMESPADFLGRVFQVAHQLHKPGGCVVGIGGEHSVTVPLVQAAVADPEDLSSVTVLQFDAHADLRDRYQDTPHSHACTMRRLVDLGAHVVAVGIRSADRDEFAYGRASRRVQTWTAQQLAEDPEAESRLTDTLRQIRGRLYVTVDVDVLDTALCPGTGTPQPGGLGWWQLLRYLRCAIREKTLLGFDVVETVPQPDSRVNETAAAKLIAKILAYERVAGSR